MSQEEANTTEGQAMYLALFVAGGLSVGFGLVSLYFSFAYPGGALNSDFQTVGFGGWDNVVAMPPADFSGPMIVVGLLCMVYANATAWKRTGSY